MVEVAPNQASVQFICISCLFSVFIFSKNYFSNSATNCSACTESGASEAFLFSASFTCLANCPAGFYNDVSTHTCESCNALCSACTNSATNCSACTTTPGDNEAFLFSANSTCLANCPAGFYNDVSTHTCESCKSRRLLQPSLRPHLRPL